MARDDDGWYAACGSRILVVEDDFFLALDEQSTLEEARAEVVGPCADEPAGLTAAQCEIDCAVLDLNLGEGPSFKIAALLRERNIPFLFVTGYDPQVIPDQFSGVERLQKPISMISLITAVRRCVDHEHPHEDLSSDD